MQPLTLSQFEAELDRLGYWKFGRFEYDECVHEDEERCALYTMPSADCCEEPPATYGDLGWQVYRGCEACCMELGGVLFCGGMYEHLRIFRGELDITGTTSAGLSELRRADEPLAE